MTRANTSRLRGLPGPVVPRITWSVEETADVHGAPTNCYSKNVHSPLKPVSKHSLNPPAFFYCAQVSPLLGRGGTGPKLLGYRYTIVPTIT